MDKQEQAAEQLFGEALEMPRDQREAFLGRVCTGKPANADVSVSVAARPRFAAPGR